MGRGVIRVRPNRWRALKSPCAERAVPLFPELAAILSDYRTGPYAPRGALLFPSPLPPGERPLRNLRRAFSSLPMPERLTGPGRPAALRPRLLRHSYCAARLQTLDGGAPISPFTVARELGHEGLDMVLRIYGHLGVARIRTDGIRYLKADVER